MRALCSILACTLMLSGCMPFAFFASGSVPLFLAGQVALTRGSGVALLLMTYTLRLMLVLLVLAVAAQTDLVDGPSLGVTVIACTLAWSALQMLAVLQARDTS